MPIDAPAIMCLDQDVRMKALQIGVQWVVVYRYLIYHSKCSIICDDIVYHQKHSCPLHWLVMQVCIAMQVQPLRMCKALAAIVVHRVLPLLQGTTLKCAAYLAMEWAGGTQIGYPIPKVGIHIAYQYDWLCTGNLIK